MTKYDNRLDQVLADCLEQIETNGLTIENCLDSYPEFREDLAKMLPVANFMRLNSSAKPSDVFQQNAVGRLQKRLKNHPRISFQDRAKNIFLTRPWLREGQITNQRSFNMVGIVVAIVVSFIFTTGGALAADNAGPGDLLYGIDLAVEQFRLNLTTDEGELAKLELEIATERLEEAEHEFEGEGDSDEIEIALNSFDEAIAALEALLDGLSPEQQAMVQETIDALQDLKDNFDEFKLEIELEDGNLEIELELENHDEDEDADHDEDEDADLDEDEDADHDDDEDADHDEDEDADLDEDEDADLDDDEDADLDEDEDADQDEDEDADLDEDEDLDDGSDEDSHENEDNDSDDDSDVDKSEDDSSDEEDD